jgi:DNA mismatch endonuclease (patch repair protein)
MTDIFSKDARSKIMASIKGKDTKPEITIRKILWSHGKRYRIHDNGILGRPDISHKGKKVAIFIDGCFWHGCHICYKEPKTNTGFWKKKMERNRNRRREVTAHLNSEGWKILEFWEHEINSSPEKVAKRIIRYFH